MKLVTLPLAKLIIKYIARHDKKRDQKLKAIADINPNYLFDINYFNDDKKSHLFDFYKSNNENSMTIIDIHGGGYVYSYKENNFYINDFFTKNGFNIINTNYTLFDGTINIKDTIKEMARLINYLYDNNDKFNIDFNNLIIKGDSAGGHIALLLTLAITNKNIADYYDLEFPKNIKINKIILNSPVYDYEMLYNLAKKFMNRKTLNYFFGPKVDLNFINQNNPSYLIRNNLVKVNFNIFVSTSYNDFLNSHSLKLKSECFDKVYLDFTFSKDKSINHIHNIINMSSTEGMLTNNKIINFLTSTSVNK